MSRFLEHLDAEVTMEDLELTHSLEDPYKDVRHAFALEADSGGQLSSPLLPVTNYALSWRTRSSPSDVTRSTSPPVRLGKAMRRLSWRSSTSDSSQYPEPTRKLQKKRPLRVNLASPSVLSTTSNSLSPLSPMFQLSPSLSRTKSDDAPNGLIESASTPSRPHLTRSASDGLAIPRVNRLSLLLPFSRRKSNLSSASQDNDDHRYPFIDQWARQVEQESTENALKSFNVISRPPASPVDGQACGLALISESLETVSIPKRRSRALSSPARRRLKDVFFEDNRSVLSSPNSKVHRRHSLATPPMTFSKRPIIHMSSSSSEDSIVKTPSPTKSLLTTSRPRSPCNQSIDQNFVFPFIFEPSPRSVSEAMLGTSCTTQSSELFTDKDSDPFLQSSSVRIAGINNRSVW